jgi:hypothetical protein
MAVEDEFRKHAERCRRMGETSTKKADRAFWLLLAENWQRLAQDREAEPPDDKETRCAVSLGAVEDLDQSQKPESSGSKPCC